MQVQQFCGWQYIIAHVVKDNEMKAAAVVAESIVTKETLEFCIWILQYMVVIEPCFKLAIVQIIFADQKLTPRLM
jgi:hypothetical protein